MCTLLALFVSIFIYNDFTVVTIIVVALTVLNFLEECLATVACSRASEVLTDVDPEDDAMKSLITIMTDSSDAFQLNNSDDQTPDSADPDENLRFPVRVRHSSSAPPLLRATLFLLHHKHTETGFHQTDLKSSAFSNIFWHTAVVTVCTLKIKFNLLTVLLLSSLSVICEL